jgi:uncharacterized SAM-binding protein YcdF (DUF218 family)
VKILIAIFVTFIVMVLSINNYLAPNDLSGCDTEPSTTKSSCMAADAIIAVSGGDTTARTNEAVALYQNGWAPKLIFSGAAQDKSGPSNAEAMRRHAREAGVPDEDILTEEYGETTKQNAENTQTIFESNKISSVILVTSPYHQRRASLEFAKRSTGVSIRNHPAQNDSQWSSVWWATPSGWYLAISELVKIIAFYVGGTR